MLPDGPRAKVASLFRLLLTPFPFLEECARRYGDTFTLRPPWGPTAIVFSDPAAVKDLFTGDPDDLRAGAGNVVLKAILGEGSLLLMDGPRHMRERKLMLPPFHGERMRAYGQAMRDAAARAVAAFPDGPFAIHPHMQAITLEVILRTVFGLEDGPRMRAAQELLTRFTNAGSSWLGTALLLLVPPQHFRRVSELGADPVRILGRSIDLSRLVPWNRIVAAGRSVDALLYDKIAERRVDRAAHDDVLSLLVSARDEDGRGLGDTELRDEMLTLLLAGHETSATTLAWVVHRLVREPEALAAVRAELDQVCGGGPISPDDVGRLEVLDAVIKETLRLHPIAIFVARAVARPVRVGGVDLEPGNVALASIYLAQRRADSFPDPLRFDHRRFLDKRIDPYRWFPFGGGTRRCLGMAFALYEMKIVLAELLRSVDLEQAPEPPMRAIRRGVTFAPSTGVMVRARRRAGGRSAAA